MRFAVMAVMITAISGCHLLYPFDSVSADSGNTDAGFDGKMAEDISSIETSADGWIPDAKPDNMIGSDTTDSIIPDSLMPDSVITDLQLPDSGSDAFICPVMVSGEKLDCTNTAGCQTNHTYDLNWSASGADKYSITITYVNLYSNDIGYFDITPGKTATNGTVAPVTTTVKYTMPSKVYDVTNTATVTLHIKNENTTLGCSKTATVTVTVK